tara:strand:- start:242 stop:703 length:462 start_codon:yes stop_codon:yes gene_type:complete
MTTVKKQFEELYAVLEENKNKKVSTILPQLIELMSKKNNASGQANTFIKNDEGEVIAIYCYYHKKWELLTEVEYGSKKGTATGYNTMCKEGVSKWTKQQRVKKAAEAELLTKVGSGELQVTDIASEQERILEESKVIQPREDGHGFDDASEIN